MRQPYLWPLRPDCKRLPLRNRARSEGNPNRFRKTRVGPFPILPAMDTTVALETGHGQLSRRGLAAGLSVVAVIGLVFIAVAAVPYLNLTTAQFGM